MAEQWKKIELADILPKEVLDALDTIDQTVQAFSTASQIFADFSQLIAPLIQGYTDPIKIAVDALIGELFSIVEDFRSSDIYLLVHYPKDLDSLFSSSQDLLDAYDKVTQQDIFDIPANEIEDKDEVPVSEQSKTTGSPEIEESPSQGTGNTFQERFTNTILLDSQKRQNLQVQFDKDGAIVPQIRLTSGWGGIERWISDVSESFFDTKDLQRPVFSDSAVVGGIVMAMGAPTIGELLNVMSAFGSILNLDFITGSNLTGQGGIVKKWEKLRTMQLKTEVKEEDRFKPKNLKIQFLTGKDEIPEYPGAVKIGAEVVKVARIDKENGLLIDVICSVKHPDGAVIRIIEPAILDNNDNIIRLSENISGSPAKQKVPLTDIKFTKNGNEQTIPESGYFRIGSDKVRYGNLNTGQKSVEAVIRNRHSAGTLVMFSDDLPGQSKAPDWRRLKLANLFPQLGFLIDGISQVALAFEMADDISKVFIQTIEDIVAKVDQVVEIVQGLANAVTRLIDLFKGSGFALLEVPSANGVNGFIEKLNNAENRPNWTTPYYVAGIVALGGTTSAIQPLLALFGLASGNGKAYENSVSLVDQIQKNATNVPSFPQFPNLTTEFKDIDKRN